MHVPDGGRTQWPAAVRTAPVVATMVDGGAVLNERPSRAMVPASTQGCVERVKDVRVQRTESVNVLAVPSN
jgi:hypothetical protein